MDRYTRFFYYTDSEISEISEIFYNRQIYTIFFITPTLKSLKFYIMDRATSYLKHTRYDRTAKKSI